MSNSRFFALQKNYYKVLSQPIANITFPRSLKSYFSLLEFNWKNHLSLVLLLFACGREVSILLPRSVFDHAGNAIWTLLCDSFRLASQSTGAHIETSRSPLFFDLTVWFSQLKWKKKRSEVWFPVLGFLEDVHNCIQLQCLASRKLIDDETRPTLQFVLSILVCLPFKGFFERNSHGYHCRWLFLYFL